jgi:pilus assembly protein FimV
MAKRVQLSSALLAGSLLHAGTAAALGLGDITLKSYLNEPLEAEVRLIDTRDLTADDIKVRLAGVEDFERMGVERSYFLTRIEFDISVDRAANRGVIRLRTQDPVLEPFIDVVIEARWPTGRLLREYTVLVDPPVFREEPLVVSASEEVAEVDRGTQGVEPEPQPPVGQDQLRQDQGRLATRGSDLAPGDMPRRAFSSETADSPAPGRRYMVRRDETLWQIASRGRPEGISVQQAMLDIQRLNPEAFIDGNINRIKAGYIIYLPAQGDISSDDLARALSEVRQQNADWAQGRETVPGVTAAASLRISADPADADAAATLAAAGAARGAAESAIESGPSTGSSATVAPTSGEGDAEPAGASSETATAPAGVAEEGGDTAVNSELAAQLDRMASRLDSLEQIVAIKDEQIASLEAALREAREAADAAPAAAAPESPRSETRSDAAAETRASKPEAGLPGWLENWPYAAGGALILALLGLLVTRRRRDASADPGADSPFIAADDDSADDVFAGVTLRDEPLAASDTGTGAVPVRAEAEPEPEKKDSPPARDNRGYGERRYDDYIDDADTGDALAEADIYIAYGRYLQAAELLNTAMTAEPENPAYRLKLMELYVDMGEPARAREQLEALRALGDEDSIARAEAILGDGPVADDAAAVAPPAEWERVPAFPSEPEFEPAREAGAEALSQTEPESEPEPEIEPAPEPEPEPERLPEPEPETQAFPASGMLADAEPTPESEPQSAAEPEPELESLADREPELELEPETSAGAAWQGSDESAPVDDAYHELELDLDADDAGQEAAASRAQSDTGTADVGAESSEVEEIDYAPLEFTLDESDYAAPEASRPEADTGPADDDAGADDEALDLELEFDELTIEEPTSSQSARGGEDELDLSEALREAEPTDASADASDHADGASDEIVFAADADQVATRLDLARAYLDMGDAEGARRILEQVAETGNEDQRSEAQSLLDRLG